ncbi:MAG: DUF692 domain-containing protein [Polyangiaceae bacterium]|nr:DUF692 domain-containing protein [Polyangiaceae bacterium]
MPQRVPDLGVGVGLRVPHYRRVVDERPKVDWFECISENFMVDGGKPLHFLDAVRETYPVILHGVSMNLGGADPLDPAHLAKLKALVRRVEPAWASDHLCWSAGGGHHLHDLLPLPMTLEVARHVARRVRQVEDTLEVPFAIENVSSYMTFHDDELSEWEFVSEVVEAADCGLLLDVNNVFVSAFNHGFDARAYLDGVPHERVFQMHLAGHTDAGTHLLDTHDHPVRDEVWELYRHACRRVGRRATSIERDDHIPELEELLAEAEIVRRLRDEEAPR